MSDQLIDFEKTLEIGFEGETRLPEKLLEWLVYPDKWVKELEAIQMQNDLLQAERDELVDYVRNLKKLALYLINNSSQAVEKLSHLNFSEVEKNFPGYLRNEIEVEIHCLNSAN
jgi:hypothetical protein